MILHIIRLLCFFLFLGLHAESTSENDSASDSTSNDHQAKTESVKKKEESSSDDDSSSDNDEKSNERQSDNDIFIAESKTKIKGQYESDDSLVEHAVIRESLRTNPHVKDMLRELSSSNIEKIEVSPNYKSKNRVYTGSKRTDEIKQRLGEHTRLKGHPAKTQLEIEMEKINKVRREEYALRLFYRHRTLADQLRFTQINAKKEQLREKTESATQYDHIKNKVMVNRFPSVISGSRSKMVQEEALEVDCKKKVIYESVSHGSIKNKSWILNFFSSKSQGSKSKTNGKAKSSLGDGAVDDYSSQSNDNDREPSDGQRRALKLFMKKFGFAEDQIDAYIAKKTQFPEVTFEDMQKFENELAESGIEPVSTFIIGCAWVFGAGGIEWAGISLGISMLGVYVGTQISRIRNHNKVKNQDKEAKRNKEEEFLKNKSVLDMPFGVKNQNEADTTVNWDIQAQAKGIADLNKYFNPKKDELVDGSICPQAQEQQNPGGTIIIDHDKKPNEKPKEEESKKTKNTNQNDGKKSNNPKEKDSENSKQPKKGQEKGSVKDASSEKKAGPNGTYQDAPYHGTKDNSVKSKKPKNGQDALDNSVPIGGDSDGRIGISEQEFVVLSPTRKEIELFHGHVREWKDLNQGMKNALYKSGKTNLKGKIFKKENK